MSAELIAIAKGIMNYVWVPLVGIVGGFIVRSTMKKAERINKLDNRVVTLENNSVREDKVREIIRQEMSPYTETLRKLDTQLGTVNDTLIQIRMDLAAKSAVDEYLKNEKEK